ncbi:hypothetical protein QBC34DRAFT_424699 [Podospora aff. communis PSN243]|uniref:Uncharacterized protein n=1 Tax=Podospora aff. communis PSN243 TaxID=3040156 RepID=A0AAV9GRJ6_9PEZI|nr:hypothetical protein QBC34DRAFT_424699 [Podospora aff. communis PSN243]
MKILTAIAAIFPLLGTLTAAMPTLLGNGPVMGNGTHTANGTHTILANGTELTTGSGGGKSFLIYSFLDDHNEMSWLFVDGTGNDYYGCKEIMDLRRARYYVNWDDCSSDWAVCCDGTGCMWSGTGCPWDAPPRDRCDFKYHDATKIDRLEIHASWGHHTYYKDRGGALTWGDFNVGHCVPQPKIQEDESFLRCKIPHKPTYFNYKQSFVCTWFDDDVVNIPGWNHPKKVLENP